LNIDIAEAGNEVLYRRTDLGQVFLPVDQMLQIDRVTEIRDLVLKAEMDLPDHWVFAVHFPNDPIFPGTLLIEAAGQALAILGWHRGLRGKPRLAKTSASFIKPLYPEDGVAHFEVRARQKRNIIAGQITVSAQGAAVAEIELTLVIV